MEIIRTISTARDLLNALKEAPDYMLDRPVECVTPDGEQEFLIGLVEIIDLINEGNRETLLRVTGDPSE